MDINQAKDRFSNAFKKVENARIMKSQVNDFAVKFKYPIFMLVCLAVITALVVFQVIAKQFDLIYIISECVIISFLIALIVLLAISWKVNLQNATCAEIIDYYVKDGKKCVCSSLPNGNYKVEWDKAKFFFTKKDEAELFESCDKDYTPFVYKKVRGHARNYALLDLEALLATFFEGATVTEATEEYVTLSSGFTFFDSDGVLTKFEINGMYSECFENNFPLYAPLSVSKSYKFTYEFTEINKSGYKMILPEIVRVACDYYLLPLPDITGVYVENNKK
ncbi:MAG: hypothetical protein IKM44_04050 [Clostridia bacterium]|nr:hypothetical protein [Clostridia bacterium]